MKVENLKISSLTKEGDCCPECNANWDGGDIYEHFLEAKFNPNHEQHSYYKDKTLSQIKETAGHYGWTEETPSRFGKVIGIYAPERDVLQSQMVVRGRDATQIR